MAENIQPPTYSLIQATTIERHPEMVEVDAKPGQYWHSLRSSSTQSISAMLIDIIPSRIFWGRSEILDQGPECAAVRDMTLSQDGKECLKCSHRCDQPWLYDASQRRDLCLPGYILFGLDMDNDYEPFIIRASGTSAGSLRELRAVLMTPKYRKSQAALQVKISSIKKQNNLGAFHVLQLSQYSPATPEQMEELGEYIQEMRALDIGASAGVPELPAASPSEKPPEMSDAEWDSIAQQEAGDAIKIDF